MKREMWQSLWTVGLIGLLFPADASAYIDPGSGSLIFQTVVATLAGVAYGARVYWSRIRAVFSRRPPADPGRPDPPVSDVPGQPHP